MGTTAAYAVYARGGGVIARRVTETKQGTELVPSSRFAKCIELRLRICQQHAGFVELDDATRVEDDDLSHA